MEEQVREEIFRILEKSGLENPRMEGGSIIVTKKLPFGDGELPNLRSFGFDVPVCEGIGRRKPGGFVFKMEIIYRFLEE